MLEDLKERTQYLERQYDTTVAEMGVAQGKFMQDQAQQMEEFRESLKTQFTQLSVLMLEPRLRGFFFS